jgi:hypothetical protein
MTIQQIYDLAIKRGIENDPREHAGVQKVLTQEKKRFEELRPAEKKLFDQEKFTNPYADTRLLVGDPNKSVQRVLVGIDIEVGEILLAYLLTKHEGKPIDLVIAHHPDGKALAGLDEVMHLQADLLAQYGVPINIAESLMEKRILEVNRSISPINHNQPIDVARILNIPYMCVHTASDNMAFQFLHKLIEEKKEDLETVGDLYDLLLEIPEYTEAAKLAAGPKIFAGKRERRLGKISLTEITGGTEGSKHIFEKLAAAGVGTVVGMHMKEEHREEADELARGDIEIIPCGGFIRVDRSKSK